MIIKRHLKKKMAMGKQVKYSKKIEKKNVSTVINHYQLLWRGCWLEGGKRVNDIKIAREGIYIYTYMSNLNVKCIFVIRIYYVSTFVWLLVLHMLCIKWLTKAGGALSQHANIIPPTLSKIIIKTQVKHFISINCYISD